MAEQNKAKTTDNSSNQVVEVIKEDLENYDIHVQNELEFKKNCFQKIFNERYYYLIGNIIIWLLIILIVGLLIAFGVGIFK